MFLNALLIINLLTFLHQTFKDFSLQENEMVCVELVAKDKVCAHITCSYHSKSMISFTVCSDVS